MSSTEFATFFNTILHQFKKKNSMYIHMHINLSFVTGKKNLSTKCELENREHGTHSSSRCCDRFQPSSTSMDLRQGRKIVVFQTLHYVSVQKFHPETNSPVSISSCQQWKEPGLLCSVLYNLSHTMSPKITQTNETTTTENEIDI